MKSSIYKFAIIDIHIITLIYIIALLVISIIGLIIVNFIRDKFAKMYMKKSQKENILI